MFNYLYQVKDGLTNSVKVNLINYVYFLSSNLYFFILKEIEKEEKRIINFYYDDEDNTSSEPFSSIKDDLIFEAIKSS